MQETLGAYKIGVGSTDNVLYLKVFDSYDFVLLKNIAMKENYKYYLFVGGHGVKELRQCIEERLFKDEKSLYNDMEIEMKAVNLKSDKKNISNETLCYERNSIG